MQNSSSISGIFKEAFEVFQDRENYLKKIGENLYESSVLWGQIALIALFTFLYGIIMGSYNGLYQSLLSGIKLWGLLLLTLLICFPSFYIVQIVLGSKIGIKQLLIMLLGGLVMVSTLMLAFAPIVLFFQLSGGNYNFLQLLHVGILVFSGVFGMRIVLESLKNACENQQVYPKIGLKVFQFWVIIFAFVGLQLSWNLRPFLGHKDMPFELFRESSQGNVYTTLLGSVGTLLGVNGDGNEEKEQEDESIPQVEPIPQDNAVPESQEDQGRSTAPQS